MGAKTKPQWCWWCPDPPGGRAMCWAWALVCCPTGTMPGLRPQWRTCSAGTRACCYAPTTRPYVARAATSVGDRLRVNVCVRVCVCACVRVCVRVCVCAIAIFVVEESCSLADRERVIAGRGARLRRRPGGTRVAAAASRQFSWLALSHTFGPAVHAAVDLTTTTTATTTMMMMCARVLRLCALWRGGRASPVGALRAQADGGGARRALHPCVGTAVRDRDTSVRSLPRPPFPCISDVFLAVPLACRGSRPT